jgi:hypothetical protein
MISYKWQFSPRFRRHAFGWKSQPAILRIKEAASEIGQVAQKEPVLAVDGAVLFQKKVTGNLARRHRRRPRSPD